MNVFLTLGSAELLGERAHVDDVVRSVQSLNRATAATTCVWMLNALAYDGHQGFTDDQRSIVAWLPETARARYTERAARGDARIRLFHPLQQLALLRLIASHAAVEAGLDLSTAEGRERWAVAAIQTNDVLEVPVALPHDLAMSERVVRVFSWEVTGWELLNPQNVNRSLGRLMFMLRRVPAYGAAYGDAVARLDARFPQYLGITCRDAVDLTAMTTYWWVGQMAKVPEDVNAAVIHRPTWLGQSTIAAEVVENYLGALSLEVDSIPASFDALEGDMWNPRELIPYRRRPLLRIDGERFAILCPPLLTEKGGIDLFWRLTQEPGGAKEKILWTDDFGLVCEGYVRAVLEELGRERIGGPYVPDVAWRLGERSGQIDALLFGDRTLVVVEVKGSFLGARVKARGDPRAVITELGLKFVQGDGSKRKGVRQLVHAIQWLRAERRGGRAVEGIDLRHVDEVIPVLCVADRSLRFPGLGQWFDDRLREMIGEASMPWRVGAMTICGLEDLERLEHAALQGGPTLIQSFRQYDLRFPHGEQPVWQTFPAVTEPHPRLDAILKQWLEDLRVRRVLTP